VAFSLDAQRKYAEAEPLYRKALAIKRNVLGEDHPDTATGYNNLALNQKAQGKYAEAEPLYRKALAIRRNVLGEDHPETATSYNNLAGNLNARGKYAEAEPLFRKALAISQKRLGEDHPDTAIAYNNLALNLNAQGKYTEAEPLYRKALAIRQKVRGEEHPATATGYSNLAVNLNAQAKYAEAEPLFRKALAIQQNALGEEHPDTAIGYNNLAANLNAQGKYAEAEPLYRKALAIKRKVLGEEHPSTAAGYNNVASNLNAQGKYAEAEPLLRKALAVRLKMLGEEHPVTADSYNNVASNLNDRGKYAEAEPLYRKALAIWQKVLGEDHPTTAQSYNNVAGNLDDQGMYAEAEPLFRKALAIRRKVLGEAHPDTVLSYSNVAFSLNVQGQYAAAEKMWRAAAQRFEIARLAISFTGLERATFATKHSPLPRLTACLARAGQPADAWTYWEATLARGLFDDLAARGARPLSEQERRREQGLIGKVQLLDKQIAALLQLKEVTAAHRQQREKFQKERDAVLVELTQFEAESARNHGPAAGQVYSLADIQKHIPADAALVGWLDIRGERKAADPNGEHWACIVRQRGAPVWVKLAGTGPKGAWTEDDDDLPGRCRLAVTGPPGTFPENLPALQRQLAAQRLRPLAGVLGPGAGLPVVRHLVILPSLALAGLPIEVLVEARTEGLPAYTVSYAPSGTLFAWLQEQRPKGDKSKRPLLLALGDPDFAQPERPTQPLAAVPDHGILLTQVLPGANAHQSGLRAGDVLLSYAGSKVTAAADLPAAMAKHSAEASIPVQVWRQGKTLELTVQPGKLGVGISQQPAADAIRDEQEFAALMQRTRGQAFARLPGTRREVEAIARLFDYPDTLLGSQASEQELDARLAAGRLRQYTVLHLATHGILDPRFAMQSALILSQKDLPDPLQQVLAGKKAYDGRLTAAQILRTWKLDADLVTLSACQSGLGKHEYGEGYVGFAQALFVAGGRSLVLSLWKVDDNATALLMTRFYQNLLGRRPGLEKPLPKAEALREARQWLQGLPAEEVQKLIAALPKGARGTERVRVPAAGSAKPYGHPYYWAAFILIGDPQ
jgi:CHAT domain-containing protein/tetratricopeptide (TPR) repeat protein